MGSSTVEHNEGLAEAIEKQQWGNRREGGKLVYRVAFVAAGVSCALSEGTGCRALVVGRGHGDVAAFALVDD